MNDIVERNLVKMASEKDGGMIAHLGQQTFLPSEEGGPSSNANFCYDRGTGEIAFFGTNFVGIGESNLVGTFRVVMRKPGEYVLGYHFQPRGEFPKAEAHENVTSSLYAWNKKQGLNFPSESLDI